jgi:hypothetical protein
LGFCDACRAAGVVGDAKVFRVHAIGEEVSDAIACACKPLSDVRKDALQKSGRVFVGRIR